MSGDRKRELHLPDLSVENFRGIRRLSIRRLGRVTLLAGRSGVGKTTVLEAARVYATRGSYRVLDTLLRKNKEFVTVQGEDHDPSLVPDYAALFCGRTPTLDRSISIGPISSHPPLRIEVMRSRDWPPIEKGLLVEFPPELDLYMLRVVYGDKQSVLPWMFSRPDLPVQWSSRRVSPALRHFRLGRPELISPTRCEFLGPGPPSILALARYWDNVVLTEGENIALEALDLMGGGIERVAVVGDDDKRHHGDGRRLVVKIRDHSHPVPLKSLGDGIVRLFAISLALASSRNGFLVIDEVENGIHYSVQQNFWHLILRAAQEYNVQVLATTHSFDCVRGFARAAASTEEAEGALVRLERKGSEVRAIEYSEAELETAGTWNIEVR